MAATIKARYAGDLRIECEHVASGGKIVTDAPLDNCGKGQAFSPTDLCCTALGACAMTIMAIEARKMGRELDGASMEITKTMAADPRRIARIDIVFHLPGGFDAEQRRRLENAATACPVCLSLGADTTQQFVFDWIQ